MAHTRPEIDNQIITQIKQLLNDHPDWLRSRLSKELCELWGWKSENGQLKDISCRDLLRSLDAAGKIKLPPPQNKARGKGGTASVQLFLHDETPIETRLKMVTPVIVEIADAPERIGEFKSFIEQYHYLGYGQSVGECIRYMAWSRDGAPLACLMFGSSAWRCAPRDKYIGWSDEERRAKLHLTTNNTRFLILPWVRIPYLASHLLSVITRRISRDWQTKYGHPLRLLETFVERGRFAGTCYKAANWTRVGGTTGRGRDSVSSRASLPIKDIYVYPLVSDFRERLASQNLLGQGNAGGQ
jgi:hypothetical protein